MQVTKADIVWAAWGITLFAAAASVVAWGESMRWKFGHLSSYRLFPLLGLLAFSIMWSHYIVSSLRRYYKFEAGVTAQYFEWTSYATLVAIFLHPGLLIWQLWRDGQGLPPGSFWQYVAPSLRWLTVVGSVSFLVFIAYEFRRKYKERTWWRYVQYASDAAMLGIFYHGLQLGSNLQAGWFRFIWLLFGITLIGSLVYTYAIPPHKPAPKSDNLT